MKDVIWFDITNSPHVFFLEPFMKHFEKKGFEIYVTARDFYRLDQLLDAKKIKYQMVGGHFGKNIAAKAFGMAHRVAALTLKIKKLKPRACIAAGSPYAMVTSKLLGIPSAWITDNDISTHMTRYGAAYASKVFLPEESHVDFYTKHGVKKEKIVLFKGLKEDFYLNNFKADPEYLKKIGVNGRVAVMRSEPSHAVYFKGEKGPEGQIIQTLLDKGYNLVYLPRTKEEEANIRKEFPSVFVPEKAVDGQNLLANSEILIGAGGSMNREAVALGTKVLSTYSGESLGVDEWLIRENYMQHNTNPSSKDITAFIASKLNKYKSTDQGFRTVVKEIEEMIQ